MSRDSCASSASINYFSIYDNCEDVNSPEFNKCLKRENNFASGGICRYPPTNVNPSTTLVISTKKRLDFLI